MSKIVRNIPDGLEASYADIKLDTIADLVNLTGTTPEIVWVSGYHTKGDGAFGSHILEWDPDSTEPHNGGTIFELGATFPTDWGDQTQLDTWFNYSGGTTGRYKLRYDDAVNVRWFGANETNTGVSGGTANFNAARQCINYFKFNTTILIDRYFEVYDNNSVASDSGFIINSATNLTITGEGRGGFKWVSGSSTNLYMFNLKGNISRLTFDGITLEGNGLTGVGESQQCFGMTGNPSYVFDNVVIKNCNMNNINVGIALGSDRGVYTNFKCLNNTIQKLNGIEAGQGYGINTDYIAGLLIDGNIIDGGTRHDIYHSRNGGKSIISNNILRNHRVAINSGSPRAAIDISRSHGVTIIGNVIADYYDSALMIAQDTSIGLDCYDILVTDNHFIGRKNLVQSISIGEETTPTTCRTHNVTIINNKFYTDLDVSTGGSEIVIWNGYDISIENNNGMIKNGATNNFYFIDAFSNNNYVDETTPNLLDGSELIIKNNTVKRTHQYGATSLVYIGTILAQSTGGRFVIKDNIISNLKQFEPAVNPSNPNSILKFMYTTTYDLPSIPANSSLELYFPISGVKPTSKITFQPDYATATGNITYTVMPHNSAINDVRVIAQNISTSAVDEDLATFTFFIEDYE